MIADNADKLAGALKTLAQMTPDQIAAHIQNLKIKGRSGTTYGCPLAMLLSRQFGGQFVIGRKFVLRRSGKSISKIATPKAMGTFVRKFDLAQYPQLIAPPPRCLRNEGSEPKRRHGKSGKSTKPGGKHVTRSKHVIVNRLAREAARFAE